MVMRSCRTTDQVDTGKPVRDDPTKPLPSDPTKEPGTQDNPILHIGGTGSSSGIIGEVVELLVILTAKMSPSIVAKAPSFLINVSVGSRSWKEKTTLGHLLRIPYRRPQCLGEYQVKVVGISVKGDVNVEKSLKLSTKFSRYLCISPSNSIFQIPTNTIAGLPCLGTVVLKDHLGNICEGYDDRDFLDVKLLEADNDDISLPRLALRKNGYQLHIPPLKLDVYSFSAFMDGISIGTTKVTTSAVLDVDQVIVGGEGLCPGPAGTTTSIEIRARDTTGGQYLENTVIDGTLVVGNVQTPLKSIYDKVAGKSTMTYTRPVEQVDYSVKIFVDDREIPDSPFQIATGAAAVQQDLTKTQLLLHSGRGATKQIIRLVSFDNKGNRWRKSCQTLAGRIVVCTNYTNSAEKLSFNKIADLGDGTYDIEATLKENMDYTVIVVAPDGTPLKWDTEQRISNGAPLEVLYASGNGLQTGFESSPAVIEVKGVSLAGEETILHDDELEVSLVQVNRLGTVEAIPYRIKNAVISYTRPKTFYQSDDNSALDDAIDTCTDLLQGGRGIWFTLPCSHCPLVSGRSSCIDRFCAVQVRCVGRNEGYSNWKVRHLR